MNNIGGIGAFFESKIFDHTKLVDNQGDGCIRVMSCAEHLFMGAVG